LSSKHVKAITFELGLSFGANCSRKGVPSKARLHAWVLAALERVATKLKHRADLALSLRLVESKEGRELNCDYRGKDYATNVLSFPADAAAQASGWLGDIVICTSVVAKEAKQQKKPLDAHYAHMLVHSVLHLVGFTHDDDANASRMEAIEIQILKNFGIANPYESDDEK
jgi:probable rRNA maturation factor